jgi:5'-deoxynucleotidase YfbR-like HD superfamily hydrolase
LTKCQQGVNIQPLINYDLKDIYEIHKKFKKSKYGQKLAGEIRFSCFKPEHISNEEWVKILGADVQNLYHMDLMKGFTKALLEQASDVSEFEKEILIALAQIHDWAEAIVGDKAKPKITKEDEEKEKIAFEDLLEEFQIDNPDRKIILTIIYDTNSRLFKIFKEIEEMGYLRTALIAWQKSKTAQDSKTKQNLIDLATCVTSAQIPSLIEKSKNTSQIAYFLEQNAETINDLLLTQTDPSIATIKQEWDSYKKGRPLKLRRNLP